MAGNFYHYTRASTLRAVLESGKIRFTRADLLDDLSEVPFRNEFINPRNFFVSSWSLKPEEHSGLWHRYGSGDTGVRIGVEGSIFHWQKIDISITRPYGLSTVGYQVFGVDAPYDLTAALGNGYVLIPDHADMGNSFGGEVMYALVAKDEVEKYLNVDHGNKTTVYGAGSRVARVKGESWADQEEYRFVLFASAGPDRVFGDDSRLYKEDLLDMIIEMKTTPDVGYIDLPFEPALLGRLTVILGAKISADDRADVLAALRTYAPSAVVLESKLNTRR